MPLITCQNLTLGYEGKVVVPDLSFSVSAGDYLCIVGENGSGKSTLLKTLIKLKAPMSGLITMGDGLAQQEIGYLPQQTAAQKDFPASVREVVLSGCLNRCGLRPYYNRVEKRLAEEHMAQLGISALAGRCYRDLSGGQQQRVLLARALCSARKLLLLDEPAAGLDPKAAAEMYALIAELNERGLTILMITHDMAAPVQCATHILHIGMTCTCESAGETDDPCRSAFYFGTKADYLQSEAGRHYAGPGGENK